MLKRLIIFGDRTAAEIEAVAREIHSDIFAGIHRCFVDLSDAELEVADELIQNSGEQIYYMIGVLELGLRLNIERACRDKNFQPWTIVHPTAYVAPSASIGPGCFIAPLTAIGLEAVVGEHSLVHFHASIGHNVVLGKHCAVLPGARISGHVECGQGVLVGSNAFVFQGTKVGERAKIDAMTYVRRDVAAGSIVSVRRPNG
jgi:acyl-[acyl carrier protein]--UDP-N-acetylglucosamine O-acyltransferase